MAAGDLITEDYEAEYNGVLIGGANTNIELVQMIVLDLPEVRTSDLPRPQDHGMLPGIDYHSGRDITLELEVWGGWTTVVEVLNAFQTQTLEIPLVFQLPDIGKMRANCRVRRRGTLPLDMTYNVAGKTTVMVQLYATDPRLYADALQTVSIDLDAIAEGMEFNVTPNIVFGVGTSPTAIANNTGTFETRPQVSIAGPVTNPFLENQTTGKTLSFVGEVPSGSTLEVDFLNRTVLLNGTASRYSWVVDSAGWWTLIPGDNSIRFGGAPGSPTPTATIQWRPAYV